MEELLPVVFLGVRGSMTQPKLEYMEYGGHTSSILTGCGESLVILDAGSGLARLPAADRPVHIFLSHLHLDHMIGLVNCRLFHDPKAEIHLYGEGRDGKPLRETLNQVIAPPFWPLTLDDFRAQITIHDICPEEEIRLPGGASVKTLRGRHPNGCLYYRIDYREKSLAYLLDCEPDEALSGVLADFAKGVDLIIWDANFIESDFMPGWGHSTWRQGLDLCRKAGAKQVFMTHFSQNHTDVFLREQEKLCRQTDPAGYFAKEGMEIFI